MRGQCVVRLKTTPSTCVTIVHSKIIRHGFRPVDSQVCLESRHHHSNSQRSAAEQGQSSLCSVKMRETNVGVPRKIPHIFAYFHAFLCHLSVVRRYKCDLILPVDLRRFFQCAIRSYLYLLLALRARKTRVGTPPTNTFPNLTGRTLGLPVEGLVDRKSGHRSKCGDSSLHTRVGPVPGHAVLGVGGCPSNARARQRPWISAVSARADSRAA